MSVEIVSLKRFDSLASRYDAWYETRLGAFVDRREKELILGLLGPQPEETILEVGSGTGRFLTEVARSGARSVGIEPSVEMLSAAISRSTRDVRFVRGQAEALPFKDAAFDCALFMTALEFVRDVDAALREATRVVRPGGRLVLGVLNAQGPWARARRRQGGLWSTARLYRADELRALLSPLGAMQLRYCVHVPPRTGLLPAPILELADRLLRRLFPASGALVGAEVRVGSGAGSQ